MVSITPIAAVVSVLGAILFFALLLMMAAGIVYLIRTRQDEMPPPEARKLGVGMTVSYFVGLVLFFASNAIPNGIPSVKILAAAMSVLCISAVPAAASALLLARKTLPERARPFVTATMLTSGVLFFCLAFAVYIAYLSLQAVGSFRSG